MDKTGPDKNKLSKSRQEGKMRRESVTFGKSRQSGDLKEVKSSGPGTFEKGRSFSQKSKDEKASGLSRERKKGGKQVKAAGDDSIRLNKYIASSGICSRREADQLISAGVITVNGKNITELGTKISPGDDVRYNGKRMRTERKVYLLLNKPKDYVTTTDDPKERKTVMMLVEGACPERIYPVGRLDRQTTGVLLSQTMVNLLRS